MSSTETDQDDIPLFAASRKVYPQSVSGPFRRAKWLILFLCLGIYYLLPFLRWDRGPHLPNQAVLADIANNRFYFFFIEIWPQEVYYFTGLLILASFVLFLMNAVAGRVWCGYLCPQTVWTDLFLAVERFFEGDRRERMRRDAEPWGFDTLWRKGAKHAVWLVIAWWTGGAWVLYFADAPTLVRELATFTAPLSAYVWIAILTFTTYALAGIMREQVCKYMCPYARFQSAMFDRDTLIVTYDPGRGEPRAPRRKGHDPRTLALGDCIDCGLCVQVCPTGIDIRQGLQYECIGCGLCVDACDTVMQKMAYPPRLIRYDTQNGMEAGWSRRQLLRRVLRPRVLVYTTILAVLVIGLLASLVVRTPFKVDVVRDRASLARIAEGGRLENVYRLQIMNATEKPRHYRIAADGLDGLGVSPDEPVTVDAAESRWVAVRLQVPYGTVPAGSHTVHFRIRDEDSGTQVSEKAAFLVPR